MKRLLPLMLLIPLSSKCPPKFIARRTDPETSPQYPKPPTPQPLEPTPAEVAASDAARAAEKARRRQLKAEMDRSAQALQRIAAGSQPPAASADSEIAALTQPELATWVEDSLFPLSTISKGWGIIDRDIKLALDADETSALLKSEKDRVRTIRRLLRALELTSRNSHEHWYEEATIQCVERINEGRLEVARDEADAISKRIKECQSQHEKELADFEREKRKKIFLLSRAHDILRIAAKLDPIDHSREFVSTPRRLTKTMYEHQVYKDETHTEEAGPATE